MDDTKKRYWSDRIRARNELMDEMMVMDVPDVLVIRQAMLIMQAAVNLNPELAIEVLGDNPCDSRDSYQISEIKLVAPDKKP